MIWLAAFVVAFLLWFYVTSTVSDDLKYTEKNLVLDIEYEGMQVLESLGYDIRKSDFDIISITVFGQSDIVEDITVKDIRAYVDLSDEKIDEAGTYKFDVKFDTGDIKGITCTSQSRDRIELVIDQNSEYRETVTKGCIDLSSWTIDKGYKISDNKSVNINEVVVEGWSLELSDIKYFRIESVSSNVISGSAKKETAGKVVLYNSAGKKIEGDDFIIKMYRVTPDGKEEVKDIVITFEVIKDA